MKIEFSSQRRERLLFLTTNMAAVTSRANQQLVEDLVPSTGDDSQQRFLEQHSAAMLEQCCNVVLS